MELLPLLLGLLLATPLATAIRELPLDMAKNSFDDQYTGCKDQMMKQVPEINKNEFATNPLYAQVWVKAKAEWDKIKRPGLTDEQAIAVRAYTLNTDLFPEFNKATHDGGRSKQEYLDNFHYKALHFLITSALSDLKKDKSCIHVYRGVKNIRFTANAGDIIRFGQFTPSSEVERVARKFGTDTFFEIDTCHGVSIEDYSHYSDQFEVLIPPFETFRVTSVTRQGEKAVIHLQSNGVQSTYNCALF